MSGALQGLKILEPPDLVRYKTAVEAGRQTGWAYYFPYLLTKNKPGRSAVILDSDDEGLCLFQWTASDEGSRLDVLFPPLPLSLGSLERSLERANDFNGDRSARVMRIDERDAEAMSGFRGLRVKQRRSQYLFAPANYRDLGGRRYRTLRRHVAAFEEVSEVEIVPYSDTHREACTGLLRRWRQEHRAAHGTAGGTGTTSRAIALAGVLGEPDVVGELVFVEGRLAAFAFGGEIRPGVACFLDAKSDPAIPGLAYAHRRSFLLKLGGYEVVNDGSDTGRLGLRQLKDSFRPVRMHGEFRARQRDADPAAG